MQQQYKIFSKLILVGVYFHSDGKPVKFQGRVLNFLASLMLDILKMIEDVVYSQNIISRN